MSTEDQHLYMQRDALERVGCEKLCEDTASGARDDRPGLAQAPSHLRYGDCLVVWRLDRLGRRMVSLIGFVEELQRRGVGFCVLDRRLPDRHDDSAGKFFLHITAALAEMERDLVRERVVAVLNAARARGRQSGRKAIPAPKQIAMARQLLADSRPPERTGLPTYSAATSRSL